MHVGKLEAEIKERSAQVDALTKQLEETQTEKSQLVQQVASINSLLEASQNKKEDGNQQVKSLCLVSAEVESWPRVWPRIFTPKDVCSL